ncbi:sulfoacetaldehyde dehydrogenase [Shimia gijangensis]|uniref:Sulfoacetaldehyde dehydrogenase n=1 Tax=Shimia gijangensis TaxID=1470563 RepID=A0A1M6T849_9RHOB|nr:aldehyde dehydrogenase family protein [Shimia gijangensis]SHK52938.1 sulfoacetaldehyde dehydrogenase [Shimia gijangensis]
MSTSPPRSLDAGARETAVIAALMVNARAAMVEFQSADQSRTDEAVTALAWAIYEPDRARELAEIAVEDTGLGNVDSKILKNTRKTFGCLRDLMRVKSVGQISDDPTTGIIKYAKPVGVVAAVTPSTNPAATPVNKAMFAIKGRNAVIVAPSPAGLRTTTRVVEYMRAELVKIGLPADLVQVLPSPVNKTLTQELMKAVDLIVVTGSQNNVKRAYSSGTPAIGVGAGNVPVVIDETADLRDAAQKISASKTFDNATSCSSENSLVILDSVYDATLDALREVGGYVCSVDEKEDIRKTLWQDGHLNRHVIAKDAPVLAKTCNLAPAAQNAAFFLVEEDDVDPCSKFTDEKLSLVLTVYRASDMEDVIAKLNGILKVCGKGHSVGIHTGTPENATRLAEEIDVVRVLENQAHTFGNGGGFDNGLNFTLTMGGGTWAGNSISDNLNYTHFLNITHLVKTIPGDKPSEEELFGEYLSKYGA